MFFSVPRCYDSHIHLLATGQVDLGLKLHHLCNAEDIKNLKIEKHHYRGPWLVGFGWDQHKWKEPIRKEILDYYFPDVPVNFSRVDGHASWLNTKAFNVLGLDPSTQSGVLVDTDKIAADMKLPAWSKEQQVQFIRHACDLFKKNGFTHVRDMSGSIEQWNLLVDLEEQNILDLYIEENFSCEDARDFNRALEEALLAKKQNRKKLRVSGIKFYIDGALGSEGALLSSNYKNSNNRGQLLWPTDDIEFVIEKTWQNNLAVAIHAIGDQAAHVAVVAAHKVWKNGIHGRLNIEHAQVVRDETIELMKNLDVVCYMQPCHWLSDRSWLQDKLGSLYKYAFPWCKISKAGIKIFWGSDSPIESPSLLNNLKALEESPSHSIAKFPENPLGPHSHPDESWGPECVSSFKK